MDAIELARRRAAELHAAAHARGVDPRNPYAFVLAEAARLKLDVMAVPPAFPYLKQGLAVLIAADQQIYHLNQGTLFEQAFLVAHELGHFVLGDHQDDTVVQSVELDRSAEPSPVGMDRVIGYSPKQRREIQMDLFAREFLLPRCLVRQLHLEENRSASEIGALYGAPEKVVMQQLIDALLLPIGEPLPSVERLEPTLNPAQQAAAEHWGNAYLLEAGPGTGKTQTLAARVEYLLSRGVDPRRILVLTYTNKAAREMAGRIAHRHPDAAAAMWIGTFHAFGLDRIRPFHKQLGFTAEPRLMESSEAFALLEEEFPRLGFSQYRNLYDPTYIIEKMLKAVSRAKDEVIDAPTYQALADKMLADATSPDDEKAAKRAQEVAQFYTHYEALKQAANSVDFGDLLLLPVLLLQRNEAIRQSIEATYDHVLVDEYQDVNRSSVELLKLLRPEGQHLWVVGDARQSIYRFRGASSLNMARFERTDFPQGRRERLTVNYRSHTEIVTAFSTFAAQMALTRDAKRVTHDSSFEAASGPGGQLPEYRPMESSSQLPLVLADSIEEMRAAGIAYRDQVILCTSNDKLATLAHALERLEVPVLFLGSLFERPEIRELLALGSLLVDDWGMGLVRVACLPEFRLSFEDLARVRAYVKDTEGAFLAKLAERAHIPALSAEGRQALDRLAEALAGFTASSTPWQVFTTLLFERTRMAARWARSSDPAEHNRRLALWQFLNFVRAQSLQPGLPLRQLLERVRRLVRFDEDHELRQLPAAAQDIDAIRLMTIHGAKGLEFQVVHLTGVNGDTMPHRWERPFCPPMESLQLGSFEAVKQGLQARHDEEQECQFYVALSRARARLFLYAINKEDKTNCLRKPSPYLRLLGKTVLLNRQVPTRSLPPTPAEPQLGGVAPEQAFAVSQLALYASCPRRFYYTHVLGLGGKRLTNAFMRLHDAARTVLHEVIQGLDEPVSDEVLRQRIGAAFQAHGLAEHGYAPLYLAAAQKMLAYFLRTRQGLASELPAPLTLQLAAEAVLVVHPDEVLILEDGRRRLRRIRTGHRRVKDRQRDIETAAFVRAAREAYINAEVEWVHLADEESQAIELGVDVLKRDLNHVQTYLHDIRAGHFPAQPEHKVCPTCPAFFVCGPVPEAAAVTP